MTELVQFPGLGLEFNINRVALDIGPITIYWYGVFIAISICIAMIYIYKRANVFGVNGDNMLDIIIYAILGGIIGARTYFVAFSWNQYKDNIMDIFKIWEGGIAIYGGIIGGFLVILLMTKRMKLKLFPVLDLIVTPLILAQAIGRWGNFVNVEAFGSNTTVPWGMTGPSIVHYLETNKIALSALGVTIDPNMPVHPTFFYESLMCFIGFLFLLWFTNKRRFDGQMTLIYLAWYGFARFIIEGLRTDSLVWGTIRVSQMLALALCVGSIIMLFVVMKKIKDKNDGNYLRLYAYEVAEIEAVEEKITSAETAADNGTAEVILEETIITETNEMSEANIEIDEINKTDK